MNGGDVGAVPGSAGVPPAPGSAGVPPAIVGNQAPPHRGWRSRGYLPHFDASAICQTITFRLADSLPAEIRTQLDRELINVPQNQIALEQRKRLDTYIDAGFGSCRLRDPDAASVMRDLLLHGHGTRYHLAAWVVMPNHVHVLLHPIEPVSRIVQRWKSISAHRIGVLPGGHLWQADYWDRYIRDEAHFRTAVAYIEYNPVTAGLCRDPAAWSWSSATDRIPVAHDAGGTPADPGAGGDARAPRSNTVIANTTP